METPHLGTPPTLLFVSLLLAGPHTGGSAALIKTLELGVIVGWAELVGCVPELHPRDVEERVSGGGGATSL